MAQEVYDKASKTDFASVVWAHQTLRALLMGNAGAALNVSKRARELANIERVERDIIRAEWLLGVVHQELGYLPETEMHLTQAITRCRHINLAKSSTSNRRESYGG